MYSLAEMPSAQGNHHVSDRPPGVEGNFPREGCSADRRVAKHTKGNIGVQCLLNDPDCNLPTYNISYIFAEKPNKFPPKSSLNTEQNKM